MELFHVSWQHRLIETKQLYIMVFSSTVTKFLKTYHVVMLYKQNNGENAYVCAYIQMSAFLRASVCMLNHSRA